MIFRIYQLYKRIRKFMEELNEKHVSAYAAKTAYFIMLSFIPFLLLLVTLIQYTQVDKSTVQALFTGVVPSTINPLINSIIDEIYGKSSTVISVSAIVTLWTAGKGITAVIQGLNSVFDVRETRNYIMLRIYGAFYTVLMLLAVTLLMVLVVFGNKLQMLLAAMVPFIGNIVDLVLRMRYVISMLVLVVMFAMLYCYTPNKKLSLKQQFPGAMFSAISWSLFSYGFSLYIDYFGNMSNMYGSLTTVVVVMLWLYMCMYLMLIGAVVNSLLEEYDKTMQL